MKNQYLKRYQWREDDLAQIANHSISPDKLENQLRLFETGTQYPDVTRPVTPEAGLRQLSEEEIRDYSALYIRKKADVDIVNFIPASGAATRMFKDFQAYRNNPQQGDGSEKMARFFAALPDLAIFPDVLLYLSKKEYQQLVQSRNFAELTEIMLDKDKLGYADKPKGLIPFHIYDDGTVRTPFEEHLKESSQYAHGKGDRVRLHFTINPFYSGDFKSKARTFLQNPGMKNTITEVSYSSQLQETDTIALDGNNHFFRDSKGHLLFRPGGHGALIRNLGQIKADIVFIKNIDNIAHADHQNESVAAKKMMAGMLLAIQEKIFAMIHQLRANTISADAALRFIEASKLVIFPESVKDQSEAKKRQTALQILDRPLRVCGMVRNTGEPGGGPFWVRQNNGCIVPQIVEKSQFQPGSERSAELLQAATHFNPVDMVCALRQYNGDYFALNDFIDPSTYFISEKSHEGQSIKVLEWPGLWNGAMANWNSVFVEIPITTFHPVKTVYDLLRPAHQKAKN
jgi:hypothetical protein